MVKFKFYLYLIVIILVNFPPLNLLPSFVSINMILKLILIILFTISILEKRIKINNPILATLSLLLLITSSLSIISAKNVEAFFLVYQNLLFGLVFLFVSDVIIDNFNTLNKIILVFLISSTMGIIFEFLIYAAPEFYKNILQNFVNSIIALDIDYNLKRGRMYYESFTQALVPVFVYFILYKKKLNTFRFFLTLFLILIIFNTLTSNNRTFFLMLVTSSLGVFFSYKFFIKRRFLRFIGYFLILYILVNFTLSTVKNNVGFNIIDRIFLNNDVQDKGTILSRFDLWSLALELGFSNIIGVGLGNFLEYVPAKIQNSYFIQNKLIRKNLPFAYYNPHNIFFSFLAEAGIFSFLTLFFLIFYFFIKDTVLLRKSRNLLIQSIIFSFWSHLLFAFFNPANSIRFYIFFWFFRILIEKLGKKIIS